jgi:hypothetical protein
VELSESDEGTAQGAGALSASRRILTICSSEKRLLRMTSPLLLEAILSSFNWSEKSGAGHDLHLQKADLVPMDTRFLTERNNQLLSDLVKNLPSAQQQKVILIR